MKKLSLITWLLFVVITVKAQSLTRPIHVAATAPVIINGNIKGLPEGAKIYIISADRDYWKDSTVVKNGRFAFRMDNYAGRSASLRLTPDHQMGKWLEFYIDKGVMNITSSKPDVNDFKISGSPYAMDFYNYYSMLKAHNYFRDINAIAAENMTAIAHNDTTAAEKVYEKFQKLYTDKAELDKKWIAAHKNSPVSSYLIYVDIWRRVSREELGKLLNTLTPKAKDNVESKELDQMVYVYKHVRPGLPAMDFTQKDTSGKEVSLKDFKGKYVLLNFWASWCEPCRAENPALVKIFNEYNSKGFTILSISLDENRNSWIKAINADQLNWTQISDMKQWSNEVSAKYAINSIPRNILVSPDGIILADDINTDDLEKKLAEAFKK